MLPPRRGKVSALPPLADMAREYVEFVSEVGSNTPGAPIHPKWGTSSRMLFSMQITYGVYETSVAIDKAYSEYASLTMSTKT